MFWNNHTSSGTMDVLSRTDLTLGELLDQENILDELKAQNAKLIEFITRQDIMENLIKLIIEEPSQDLDERERYRKSNLACEVLTTDLPALNEKLAENNLLSQLFKFLEGDAPLNPLLASFFSRTMSVLISRKSDQHWYSYQYTCLHVIEFCKSKENCLGLLLKHIGTSAIMDLALKLITQVEGCDIRSIIVNWFESEGLINNVISLFEPSIDSDRHYNAAQLLCDTMEKSREINLSNLRTHKTSSADDSILSAIQSPDTVQKLLSYMLDGELSESSLISGISVLLALIDIQAQVYYDSCESNAIDENCGDSPPPINPVYRSIVAAIVPYLPKFCNLLLNPPHKNGVKLAYGLADPPLGNTRLNIIKLIANLIETRWPLPEVHAALIELDTFNILLDLFFKYTWNNFLHSQIYKCLKTAFGASLIDEVDALLPNIFVNCRLLQRILNAWEENESEEKNGGKRRGYMGHVILISTLIDGLFRRKESVKELIEEEVLTSWKEFISDYVTPVVKTQAKCLGGQGHPGLSHEEDSDGNDYTDIKFGNDVAVSDQNSEDQPATTYILEHYWNTTDDPGSGSSDEEEKAGTDSKDSDESWAKSRGYFRTNNGVVSQVWTKGECQPTDIENPWGSEPLRPEELENEKWADFESYFDKFESSLSFEEPTTSGQGWENKPAGETTEPSEPVCVESTDVNLQENVPLEPEVILEEGKLEVETTPVEATESVPSADGDSQASQVPVEPEATQSPDTLPQIESTNDVVSETETKTEEPAPVPVVETPERIIYEDHDRRVDENETTTTEVADNEPVESGDAAEPTQNSSESQDDDGGGSA